MNKKIKNAVTNFIKKHSEYRDIVRDSFNFLRGIKYKIGGIGKKIDEKTILFSCFNGVSYTCSPKALYEEILKSDKYDDYKLVWVFKDPEKYKFLLNNKNTILVKRGSKEYRKYLHTAKYWFFNFKIADSIYPTKDQVFLQCWHGTPLKRLGCDLENFDNLLNSLDGMKKRYKMEAEKFSYFISPSKFASEKFTSAWNLKEIGKENIMIEKGYPRNDFLFNYTEKDIENMKRKILGYYYLEYEKNIKKKKIILYAPTYRANQHETGVGYVYKNEVDFDKLREKLGDDYIILFRPHYFIANAFDFEKYDGFVYNVSDIDDINGLYIISDILITDYSSVFFDYANLKRPMIFYMYDLEHYRDESNGFYIDVNKELPGKIVRTDDELIDEIERVSKEFKYDDKYKKFNDTYNYLDDGNASKRVLDVVLNNKEN